jgi:Ribosome-binding factor A
MANFRNSTIRHAQKESVLLHEIAKLFMQITADEPELQSLSLTRVRLSPDKSSCIVYIHGQGGLAEFEAKRKTLVLYHASMRKALANSIDSRYVPRIRFMYDAQLDKQRHIDDLIDGLKDTGKL